MSIRFARYTVDDVPATDPDSNAKFITLDLPIVVPAALPPEDVCSSCKLIVSYNLGASYKLVMSTKLPKSEVTVLFISVSNVLGLSTSLYVVDILSVL